MFTIEFLREHGSLSGGCDWGNEGMKERKNPSLLLPGLEVGRTEVVSVGRR